jgi:hypothetical protein
MSGKILDTDFFNQRVKGKEDLESAFHLLRREMFEAQAEAAQAKTDAEVAKAAEAKVKADAVETKLTKLEKMREIYFNEFGPSFLTASLEYANKARKAAEAAQLRFASYVEEEKKELEDKTVIVVGVKLKCVAKIPQKKQQKK